eukprot:4259818-Amphidinium_carterae.1
MNIVSSGPLGEEGRSKVNHNRHLHDQHENHEVAHHQHDHHLALMLMLIMMIADLQPPCQTFNTNSTLSTECAFVKANPDQDRTLLYRKAPYKKRHPTHRN